MVKHVQVDKAPNCVLVLVNEGGPEAGRLGTSLWATCNAENAGGSDSSVERLETVAFR